MSSTTRPVQFSFLLPYHWLVQRFSTVFFHIMFVFFVSFCLPPSSVVFSFSSVSSCWYLFSTLFSSLPLQHYFCLSAILIVIIITSITTLCLSLTRSLCRSPPPPSLSICISLSLSRSLALAVPASVHSTHSPHSLILLTYSLTHLFSHSLILSLTYSLTHLFSHSLILLSLTYSLTHSLTHSLTQSLTH